MHFILIIQLKIRLFCVQGKLKTESVIREIFTEITHRGPDAFQKLIRSLNDSNNALVVAKLDNTSLACLRNNNNVNAPAINPGNLDDSGNGSFEENM